MKLIKEYKSFKSINDIQLDIEDILLEVEDIGYITECKFYPNGRWPTIKNSLLTVNISANTKLPWARTRTDKSINIEEVQDCVNRILGYMKSQEKSYEVKVYVVDFDENDIGVGLSVDEIDNVLVKKWKNLAVYSVFIKFFID